MRGENMEAAHSPAKQSSTAARALHPLSPERVNNSRLASAASTATTFSATSKESEDLSNERKIDSDLKSPQSSPVRRTKPGGPFAEYAVLEKSKGFALPSSPSLPEFHALKSHLRTNSDVQGLVQRFEHLDVRDRDAENATQRKKLEAQIRRAEIAREEAESDVARLREETRRLRKERDEGLERERKVGKRLEAVMEDFSIFKESSASQTAMLEKELRKMRKETFKSSSAVVKLQEELKSTRATLRVTHSNLDMERKKLQRKEQDRFEMEFKLVPLQEQVDKLTQQLNVAEEEREALKKTIKAEEIAQVAANGMIALPESHEQDDELSSPRRSLRKGPSSPWSDDKENMQIAPHKNIELKRIEYELENERIRRKNAEDMADFLRAECMFGCCACKRIRRSLHGEAAPMTNELANSFEEIRAGWVEVFDIACDNELSMHTICTDEAGPDNDKPTSENAVAGPEVEAEQGIANQTTTPEGVINAQTEAILPQKIHDVEELPFMMEVDRSMTLIAEDRVADSSANADPPDPQHDFEIGKQEDAISQGANQSFVDQSDRTEDHVEERTKTTTVPLRPETPPRHHTGTPFRQQPHLRTITTTVNVPIQFTPVSKPTKGYNGHLGKDGFDAAIQADTNHGGNNSEAIAGDALAPQPFDRAAALAAIEYRRGRARSFAAGLATPQKQMFEGVRERRDVSAPTLGQKAGSATNTAPVSQGTSTMRSRSVGRHNRR